MSEYLTEPFTRPVSPHSSLAGDAFPPPPELHWVLVLLFTVLTLGIFILVWIFIQSNWARKIDPASNATTQFIAYLVLFVLGQILSEASSNSLKALAMLLMLGSYIVFYFGAYSIRRSMLNHYSKVEPMQLKLSAAMVFFFSAFYLQYHMTRIARWKATRALAS